MSSIKKTTASNRINETLSLFLFERLFQKPHFHDSESVASPSGNGHLNDDLLIKGSNVKRGPQEEFAFWRPRARFCGFQNHFWTELDCPPRKGKSPHNIPSHVTSHATIQSPNAARTNSRSPKPAAWTQCDSTPDLTFAITASLARAAMRGSLSDGRNDYKSRRQKRAVYTPLRSINVCSRANQTAACARAPEQHTQTQQSLRDDL